MDHCSSTIHLRPVWEESSGRTRLVLHGMNRMGDEPMHLDPCNGITSLSALCQPSRSLTLDFLTLVGYKIPLKNVEE